MEESRLVVPDGISLSQVLAHVHDKGQRQVNNDRGAEGKAGGVDKKEAYGRGCDAQFISQSGTNAEGVVFKIVLQSFNHVIHNAGL